MEIYGISDMHGEFIDIPKCIVLCICGDIVGLNDQRSIDASRKWWYNRFTSWVNRLPCEKVIITPGNHDFFLEDAYKKGYLDELKQDLSVRTNGKLVILINEEYVYRGLKFYGCPFIRPISFQEGRWAFEDNYNGRDSIEECCYNFIPEDTDVLITHDNPYMNAVLGMCIDHKTFKNDLYHLYGHWHGTNSHEENRAYNCSILDDMYNRKKGYKPIIIEVMTKEEIVKFLYNELIAYSKLTGKEKLSLDDIKECFEFHNEFISQMEDEIPLPITGNVIENVELGPILEVEDHEFDTEDYKEDGEED